MDHFDEYKHLGEPEKHEKAENWQIAIGLQAVDGLTPSQYLIALAKKNIEGDISIAEVKSNLDTYYKENPAEAAENRTDEADKVSAQIAGILAEKTFTLSPAEYIAIHQRLFEGVYAHAGQIRGYNITKEEWVLGGDTVLYASFGVIKNALDYDFEKEKTFSYRGLSKRQTAEHIADFTTGIWQIHPFCEGNTRTTAVFIIKYLRALGFRDVTNDLFAKNALYFRNALVRAAASNVAEGVYADRIYLDRFFGNLLLGENHVLKNRDLHMHATQNATLKPENATVNATVKLTATQSATLALLRANGKLTAADIAGDIGKDISTVKRAIKALKEKGLLVRSGSDRTGHWRVTGREE